MTRFVILLLILMAGCTYEPETLDQLGHRVAGRIIACDRVKWTSPELAIQRVMEFAEQREDDQHPGECGPGCILDLENWRRGAEIGARCTGAE